MSAQEIAEESDKRIATLRLMAMSQVLLGRCRLTGNTADCNREASASCNIFGDVLALPLIIEQRRADNCMCRFIRKAAMIPIPNKINSTRASSDFGAAESL